MDYTSILMLVLLLVVFYFMLIRPENKRKKAAEQMRSSLKKGDKLTTIGGIVGTVVQVGDDTMVIETGEDRVRMEITKWAVSTTGVQTSTDGRNNGKKKEISDEVPEEPAEAPVAETPAEDSAATEETKD
ncbi:MAG: preprotein translocase subunit YajC [Oscillibacter sp.]|jgi:preprotein translocase subunit YajC|nr:preprotein translocase subunit YajC [Oscillibacter sp.]